VAQEIILYEPTLCCSSGVCGPNPDQALVALQDTIDRIKEFGICVERFQITTRPRKFMENAEVMNILQKQINALPITTVDGKIIKIGSYPSLADFQPYL